MEILTDRTTALAEKSMADKELYSCCRRLVEQKLEEPGDDIISRRMTGPLRDCRMHPEEAYRSTVQLVSGGHDTTAATITIGVLTMLVKPEWRQALREQPEAVPDAVEELLRFHTHDGPPTPRRSRGCRVPPTTSIGQWLARAEIQTAISAVATEIPTLRLAVPFEKLTFRKNSFIAGVRELPVTW